MPRRRFQFDLSPVLGLRARAVDQAREALGRAVQARLDAQAALDHARALSATAPTTPQTVAQLGGAAIHRTALARACETAERTLSAARVREQTARRALADAICDHEALLSLRTQAADAHRARALKAEASALDDIAIAGHTPSTP